MPCACASGTIQAGSPNPLAKTGTFSSSVTATCLRKYSCVGGMKYGRCFAFGSLNSRRSSSTNCRCSSGICASKSSWLPLSASDEGTSRSTPNGLSVSDRTVAIMPESSSGL